MLLRTTSLALLAAAITAPAAPASSATTAVQATVGGVVSELNRVRANRGLRPLQVSPSLGLAARRHSSQMGRLGFFDHSSSDGTPFWRRIERFYGDAGFRHWEVGENIFWQSPATLTARVVVRAWLASPPHRATLLSSKWREVGVGAVSLASAPGVYDGRPVAIVTVDFGLRR